MHAQFSSNNLQAIFIAVICASARRDAKLYYYFYYRQSSMPEVMQMYPTSTMSVRGFVLFSSTNCMTFHDYFRDLFKFPMTFSLAVSRKLFCLIFRPYKVQQTQTLVSTKMCAVLKLSTLCRLHFYHFP